MQPFGRRRADRRTPGICRGARGWTFALPVDPVAPIAAGQAALASASMITSAVSGVSRASSEVAKILWCHRVRRRHARASAKDGVAFLEYQGRSFQVTALPWVVRDHSQGAE